MQNSTSNFLCLLFTSLDTKNPPKLRDLTAKFPSLPSGSILQRRSFKLTSGLHRFPELDPFQPADVMQWKPWGFQLAFTNLTVVLRQEKKKSAFKFQFKYCPLTNYPESGDILGFRSESYLKSDFRHFHRKRKYLCNLGATKFSKELMKTALSIQKVKSFFF